ncbi:MAG: hypothetical protein ABSB22_18470 [Thermodesulfobacteriota bacterium]
MKLFKGFIFCWENSSSRDQGFLPAITKLPKKTEKGFYKHGFFRTGDLAMINDAKNFKITCRIREMINRGGLNNARASLPDINVPRR